MPSQPKQNEKPLSFEEAFKELEAIVAEFDRGALELEKGLELFRRAISLAEICKKRLDEVENKVVAIKQQFADFAA